MKHIVIWPCWLKWELILGLCIYLITLCLSSFLAEEACEKFLVSSQASTLFVFQTLFYYIGLLFHRTSHSPGSFLCLLSTEIVSRLGFCCLLGIFHLAKFVPCGILKSKGEVTGSGFWAIVGKTQEIEYRNVKSKWEVRMVILVACWVLDHIAHLYVEGQQKGHRKQRNKKVNVENLTLSQDCWFWVPVLGQDGESWAKG